MTLRRWTLYGLVAIGTGIVNLPASLVGKALEHTSQQRIRMLYSQGTIWHGQLNVSIQGPKHTIAIPNPIEWRIHLWPSQSWPRLTLTHTQLTQPLEIAWTHGQWSIRKGSLQLPAAWLSALGAPFNTIRPEGVLLWSWENWDAEKNLNIQCMWRDAQSALSNIRPLGEYTMTLSGSRNHPVQITISTQQGPLILEGQGTWDPKHRFSLTGFASAHPKDQIALQGLMSQLGKQEGNRYRLTLF